MAVPLGGLVALVAAAAWLTPTALEINPSRWPAVVTLIIMVIGATLWFGPFMVNLGGGALRATSFLRTDGAWLLIGSPFTRRVRLTDIETVATRHAEGNVFEVIIDVHRRGGARRLFSPMSPTGMWTILQRKSGHKRIARNTAEVSRTALRVRFGS